MTTALASAPRAGGASGARPPQAALGNTANKSSAAELAADRRARRDTAWGLRRRLWDISTVARLRACGRVTHTGGGPTLRVTGAAGSRVAGLAGLQSCGSVWSCPVCARKIGARRAEEIRQVVTGAFAAGGGAVLVTLTLRHHAGQPLRASWDAARYAWSRVTSGRRYAAEVERFGLLGWAAVIEVTHGEAHGWHPHLHVLVLFDRPVSEETAEVMACRWWMRWEAALGRKGYTAVANRGGLDARLVSPDDSAGSALGTYLSKLAHEVTGAHTKDGRHGNRTPFAILRDGLATGLADDIEAWWQWEQASHGRKQLTWSKGTRERFGLGGELTDEEIAEQDLASADLVALPPETWRVVRPVAEQLLTVAEVEGLEAACRWLTGRGLAWTWGRGAPRRSRRREIDISPDNLAHNG